MSVFTAFKKKEQLTALHSQYIKTENEPDKDTKPEEEPANPAQPEAK